MTKKKPKVEPTESTDERESYILVSCCGEDSNPAYAPDFAGIEHWLDDKKANECERQRLLANIRWARTHIARWSVSDKVPDESEVEALALAMGRLFDEMRAFDDAIQASLGWGCEVLCAAFVRYLGADYVYNMALEDMRNEALLEIPELYEGINRSARAA